MNTALALIPDGGNFRRELKNATPPRCKKRPQWVGWYVDLQYSMFFSTIIVNCELTLIIFTFSSRTDTVHLEDFDYAAGRPNTSLTLGS